MASSNSQKEENKLWIGVIVWLSLLTLLVVVFLVIAIYNYKKDKNQIVQTTSIPPRIETIPRTVPQQPVQITQDTTNERKTTISVMQPNPRLISPEQKRLMKQSKPQRKVENKEIISNPIVLSPVPIQSSSLIQTQPRIEEPTLIQTLTPVQTSIPIQMESPTPIEIPAPMSPIQPVIETPSPSIIETSIPSTVVEPRTEEIPTVSKMERMKQLAPYLAYEKNSVLYDKPDVQLTNTSEYNTILKEEFEKVWKSYQKNGDSFTPSSNVETEAFLKIKQRKEIPKQSLVNQSSRKETEVKPSASKRNNNNLKSKTNVLNQVFISAKPIWEAKAKEIDKESFGALRGRMDENRLRDDKWKNQSYQFDRLYPSYKEFYQPEEEKLRKQYMDTMKRKLQDKQMSAEKINEIMKDRFLEKKDKTEEDNLDSNTKTYLNDTYFSYKEARNKERNKVFDKINNEKDKAIAPEFYDTLNRLKKTPSM